MKKPQRISLFVEAEDLELLGLYASMQSLPRSHFIRRAIKQYLQRVGMRKQESEEPKEDKDGEASDRQ